MNIWQVARTGLIQVFSILSPLPELVHALNEYQPTLLSGYPSALALLAREQVAGRLQIAPILIVTGGECLDQEVRLKLTAGELCSYPRWLSVRSSRRRLACDAIR
jgi:phenylacetate-coenzyme A ligase PaaK-like adenylate-forming protein